MTANHPLAIRRALISVSDKTGIVDFAKALSDRGIEILSTGGTAKVLSEAGLNVKDVAAETGFPEMMDGRVKTLHPRIHAAILERSDLESDRRALNEHGITPIDMVVVNLYPFSKVVGERIITSWGGTAADSEEATLSLDEAIEVIDIGGPSMIRAAAKNMAFKAVVVDPAQYDGIISELRETGGLGPATRFNLARNAFSHTAWYDAAIASALERASIVFDGNTGSGGGEVSQSEAIKGTAAGAGSQAEAMGERGASDVRIPSLPSMFTFGVAPVHSVLRYGENPHQTAAFYGDPGRLIECLHGKELSYNNYLDIDAALALMADFQGETPAAAILKHTVPCGLGTGATLRAAYERAFATDRTSPFGGVIVFNRPVDLDTASIIDEIFSEIVAAPGFNDDAFALLSAKKNRRLIRIAAWPTTQWQWTSILGGTLLQSRDSLASHHGQIDCVTRIKPTDPQMKALRLAWNVVRHVKSNGIVIADANGTLGIGTGQTSRIRSTGIAIQGAREEGLDLTGSALASDAFFPFPDGVTIAAEAGVSCIIQPGGSVRDREVIEEADARGLSMLFTHVRHFRH